MRITPTLFYRALLTVITALLFFSSGYASEENGQYKAQPSLITSILQEEKNNESLTRIIELINHIDGVYTDLHENLSSGKKITIFFDPAHGKLSSGKWEGAVTGRLSCTGKPEEYYSILLSRKFYKLLLKNTYIDVKSTNDFMEVLKNNSDEYNNILFPETIRLAKESSAFIILSEHLNNISGQLKADGLVNLFGVHITVDTYGNRYLSYIKDTQSGFLTLYNKFDVTGFSKALAVNTKDKLVDEGLSPNSWEYGTVADDRFLYYTDFPVSVIFESGFISNPEEEELLVKPEYQDIIVKAQYDGFIDALKEIYGVDISGDTPVKTDNDNDTIVIFKLSRIAMLYMQNCEIAKAVRVLQTIEKNFKKDERFNIKPYSKIKNRLLTADGNFRKYKKLLKEKETKKARKYLIRAVNCVKYNPLYISLYDEYSAHLWRGYRVKIAREREYSEPAQEEMTMAKKSHLTKPIILPIEEDQNLEEALEKALCADEKTCKKIITSLRKATMYEKVKKKGSKRKYYTRRAKNANFTPGVYIVHLNKNRNVKKVNRVKTVRLDPAMYQNHQYLKNSHFASQVKEKSL